MKGIFSIGLLILTNIFIFLAWYGHLKFKELKSLENIGIFATVMINGAVAFLHVFFRLLQIKLGTEY